MKINNISTNIYNNKNINSKIQKKQSQIAFGANPHNFLRKLNEKLEYSGISMPVIALGIVSFFAILLPRLIKARDNTERAEILQRDVTTIIIMMIGSFSLRNIMSTLCAKKSGYALMNGNNKANPFVKTLNLFNPLSSTNILSSSQLVSKYSKIDDYKEGFYGFAKFLNENGGDAKKFFSSNKNLKSITEDLYMRFKPKNASSQFKNANKNDIAEMFKNINNSSEKTQILKDLTKLFKETDNSFVKKAKFMNSFFDFLSTFLFIPFFLGVGLPKMNEKTVRKMLDENAQVSNKS